MHVTKDFIQLRHNLDWIELIGEDFIHDGDQLRSLSFVDTTVDHKRVVIARVSRAASAFGCRWPGRRLGLGHGGERQQEADQQEQFHFCSLYFLSFLGVLP
jgi:hypothetical protein